MSLGQRSVTSVAWNVVANLVKVVLLLFRSIALARLLPVDSFGIYAWAGSIVTLAIVLPNFGMSGAFLHRAPETQDENESAAVHFTLSLIFTGIWTALMAGGALLFASSDTRLALLVLTLAFAGMQLTQTPRLILTRRVVHRRLALIELLTALFTTVVSLALAWGGATLWALLVTDLVATGLALVMLYVWHPVWRPRLAWTPSVVRYYLSFGSRVLGGSVLAQALDRVDDLWTGFFLGNTALGYYSRAYRFATYPRTILAAPIDTVAAGTYAELKGQSKQLSQAFYRVNALLVRSGFLLGGVIALVAPEFIRLALGAKWLPMLEAFRLMLVFTLFDPLKSTVAGLLVAVGKPELVVRARTIQLVALLAGLFLLGPRYGISGVALAVDLMLFIGIALLLRNARAYVDFSFRRLFAVPAGALFGGLVLGILVAQIPWLAGSDWRTLFAKGLVFTLVYVAILIGLEGKALYTMLASFPMFRRVVESIKLRLGHHGAF